MGVSFCAEEIYEIAEHIEYNGIRFYRNAAERCSGKRLKKLLLEIAEMEVEHQQTFAAMRAELSSDEKLNQLDLSDEVGLYLQAMADNRVFDTRTDPCELLTGNESMEAVLKMAIGLEKDSIVFYLGLEEYVSDKAGKVKVRALIRQEMGHIAVLRDMLTSSD